MAFFALADLHLGLAVDKPMEKFGEQWRDHPTRIADNWRRTVGADDVVLIPGDISWAMRLDAVQPDLLFLAQLPGRKVLLRGNHDYWWQSLAKVREALPPGFFAIQNDHVLLDGVAICGARGWSLPGAGEGRTDEDQKIYLRERRRLDLSLSSAPPDARKVAMIHFPPVGLSGQEKGFGDLLQQYQVELCVYGHLHGDDHRLALRGEHDGVFYVFCAADAVDFTPVRLPL
jgi:hypothetical protein